MKKNLLAIFISFISFFSLQAQTIDTIQVDLKGYAVKKGKDFNFKRIIERKNKETLDFTDYYKSGEVRKVGSYYTKFKRDITRKNFKRLQYDRIIKRDGNWVTYSKTGDTLNYTEYDKQKTHVEFVRNEKTGLLECTLPEIKPTFPGGTNALRRYVSAELKYPPSAAARKIQGIVYVSFIVDEMGFVKDVKIARGKHKLLDEEAMRVVRSMPRWSPGQHNDKPIAINYTIPVNFRIQQTNPHNNGGAFRNPGREY